MNDSQLCRKLILVDKAPGHFTSDLIRISWFSSLFTTNYQDRSFIGTLVKNHFARLPFSPLLSNRVSLFSLKKSHSKIKRGGGPPLHRPIGIQFLKPHLFVTPRRKRISHQFKGSFWKLLNGNYGKFMKY